MKKPLIIALTAGAVIALAGAGVAVNAATLSLSPTSNIGQVPDVLMPVPTPSSTHEAGDDSLDPSGTDDGAQHEAGDDNSDGTSGSDDSAGDDSGSDSSGHSDDSGHSGSHDSGHSGSDDSGHSGSND